jgi:predicted nucleotidyltransferase
MQQQTLEVRKWGNSAGILVPREWLGEKVVVTRMPQKPLKERILGVLAPHLEHIIGAYLYGSRARGDETIDSDIDLFIITDKKIEIKAKGFEIALIEKKELPSAFEGMSALISYSMLAEAKPIINPELLEDLKKVYRPELKNFRVFTENTRSILNVHKSLLDYDKEEDKTYIDDGPLVYSLILRLRGVYIIKCLLSKKQYRKRDFDDWVKISSHIKDYSSVYNLYLAVKNKRKGKQKILLSDLVRLYELLARDTSKMEEKLNGKTGKKT